MEPPGYPVCSPGSAIAHPSSVFSSPPLPAILLSMARPQAVPLSQVLSQMGLFPLAPYFRRTTALTRSAPLWEGLTKRWSNERWPNVSCTQELLLDPAATRVLRLQPGASPTQKKFARQCSLSVSGTMENCNPHLLGPGGFNSLSQMSFQQWNCFSPCGLRTSQTPLCSRGFAFSTRAPPGMELQSCSL